MKKEITNDILIIDDEPEVLELFEQYCEEMKVFRKIITSRDGLDASKKLRNQNFALILLDIHMPKKSGMDVLYEIAEGDVNKTANVILISGDLSRKSLSDAIELGAKNIMVKPLGLEAFMEKVESVLRKVRPDLYESISA